MNLSLDQQIALEQVNNWLRAPTPYITLGGYAGTGKTTLIAELCRQHPKLSIAVIALTGKAVSVLASKLSEPNASVSTIHHFMYAPVTDPVTKKILGWNWRPMEGTDEAKNVQYPTPYADLIINDEASMTSSELFNDLRRYNVPILCVGDHGQLPPVKGSLNLMENPSIRLEQIHRQAADNPIIQVATQARTRNMLEERAYSEKVYVMRPGGGPYWLADLFLSGDKDNLIIVSTNSRRVETNKLITSKLGSGPEPFIGARLICLKNERALGLYNGMQVELSAINRIGHDYWDVNVTTDAKDEIRVKMALAAFNQAKPTMEKLTGTPFDFGYAVTCHKAQGSEAKRVFVLGQGFGSLDDRRRWMYTAVTRAQEELYVIL